MILLCYALEILVNNIINRMRTRETWCRIFARNIVSRESGGRSPGIPHRRGGQAAYYPGKKDHHRRVTTERPHPTGGSCPREGHEHGKGKLIRILFSVYFGGFRG
jgi:hypothetical protein